MLSQAEKKKLSRLFRQHKLDKCTFDRTSAALNKVTQQGVTQEKIQSVIDFARTHYLLSHAELKQVVEEIPEFIEKPDYLLRLFVIDLILLEVSLELVIIPTLMTLTETSI